MGLTRLRHAAVVKPTAWRFATGAENKCERITNGTNRAVVAAGFTAEDIANVGSERELARA